MKRKNQLAIWILGTLLCCGAMAAQTDITFVVVGKTGNFQQLPDDSRTALNYHFFAEIFRQPGGTVAPASITGPGEAATEAAFTDSGYALEVHGGRYRSEAELERAYPDGDYLFHYTAPSTGAVSQAVRLVNGNVDGSGLPAAPQIFLSQRGQPVTAGHIDPEADLEVRWSSFEAGGADPAGIMDDLVFVILGDCDGVRRAHSGRPYEHTPYLTYADTSFTIEASRLLPDNVYQLSVEHAVLDTSIEHGVVGFATFATTTFLDIRTSGEAAPGRECHTVRKRFDAGSTPG